MSTPEGVPPPPKVAVEYPNVHDIPPQREKAVLTTDEQGRLEGELLDAHARQTRRHGAEPAVHRQTPPATASTPASASDEGAQ